MARTVRCYLFEDGENVKRIPRRVVDAMVFGNDALPEYVNTTQRVAEIVIENEQGKALEIVKANGVLWSFDENGKIDEELRKELRGILRFRLRTSRQGEGRQPAAITEA
jgi:hypothetical protein